MKNFMFIIYINMKKEKLNFVTIVKSFLISKFLSFSFFSVLYAKFIKIVSLWYVKLLDY